MSALLSVSEAKHKLLSVFKPLESEIVPLSRSVGRVLSESIRAVFDIPLFDNSSMDGFAVRAADVSSAQSDRDVELAVIADIAAGQMSGVSVAAGQAARIMTGAPLPLGADAVVPVEETNFNERQAGISAPEKVKIFRSVRSGENVRSKGQDVRAGELVLQAGTPLRPQEIGFLAMLGKDKVPLHRVPRVAVFATGDELVPVGEELKPGQIYDSNSYTLISQIENYGAQAVNLAIVRDNIDAVQACLDRAKSYGVDMIISSAGVSVGAFDFVRHVVERGGHLDFWRVNMRPGKPLAFGEYKGIPFIGLPGNPVSAFVGFEVFIRPAILKMCGFVGNERPFQRVKLLEAIASDGRESYLRGIATHQDGAWLVQLTGHQGSGNLRSLVQANALLLVPSGVKSLPAGAEVDAWLLDDY